MTFGKALQATVIAVGLLCVVPVAEVRAQAAATPEASWSDVASNPWVYQGAVVGMFTVNALTGGAMLAPLVGPTLSSFMGGGVLGSYALSAPARQALCQTTTLLAWMAAGAGAGYLATQQWPELLEQ